jgi:GMP synthase-like glutamine amidotransferase
MLLVINNTTTPSFGSESISGLPRLKRALGVLDMPFYEVSCYGINREVLDPEGPIFKSITGVIISGSIMKLSKLVDDISTYVHILHYLQAFRHVPVLGLCFGAQLLVVLYGGFVIDNRVYTRTTARVEVLANHKLFRLNETNSKKSTKTQRRISKRTAQTLGNNNSDNNKRALIRARFFFSDIPIVTNRRVKPIAWVRGNNSTLPVAFEFERGRVYGSMFHPEHSAPTYYILKNVFT